MLQANAVRGCVSGALNRNWGKLTKEEVSEKFCAQKINTVFCFVVMDFLGGVTNDRCKIYSVWIFYYRFYVNYGGKAKIIKRKQDGFY